MKRLCVHVYKLSQDLPFHQLSTYQAHNAPTTQKTERDKMKKQTSNGPRQLPTVNLKKKKYYVDERLGQLRNVDNPHNFIDFLRLYRKKPFVLLGTYQNRMNIEIVAMSDDSENLESIRAAILELNSILEGKDRDFSNPQVVRLIENKLSEIDIVDDATEFVYEIDVIGIFKIEPLSY